MMVLLMLLFSFLGETRCTDSFDSKSNTKLYCEIKNQQALSELTMGPQKHLYTDYSTGKTLIYNGATVTMKCKDPKKTFTNKMVQLIGDSLEYQQRKQVIVQCLYETILLPDIFTGVEQYCASGCPAPTFSSGYLVRKGTDQLEYNTEETEAPVDEGEYNVVCSDGYVRAWKDDGGNMLTCKDGKYNATQSDLLTCAPGCLDLSVDILPYRCVDTILPYRRALAIKPQDSTPLNQVWPGAPYPWGAVLEFGCFDGSNNKLSGSSKLYCYKSGKSGTVGDCGSCTSKIGWWNGKAPECKYSGTSTTHPGVTSLVMLLVMVLFTR